MITGTPLRSAGAAFSHKPHAGKLKALINNATPGVGVKMCWEANKGSFASRELSPSIR